MAPPKSNVNPAGSGPFFHAKGHEVEKSHALAGGGNSWTCKTCKQSYDPDEVHAAPEMTAADAAKKVGALLDGNTDPDFEPSGVVTVEAPAGLANVGERLVGQNKASKKWRDSVPTGAAERFVARASPPMKNVVLEGEPFDFHPGAWPKAMGKSLYVANKLIGESRVGRDTPLSHLDLYSAYKSTPHAPASMFLKYLVHRINHVEDYENPTKGHALDVAFQGLVTKGGAAEKNGHVSLQDLHDWTARHATTVVPQLLGERAKVQMDVARGIGLNVRSINGEPYVALTRGLNSEIMEDEHPLSSHADTADTGFGDNMHHSWVPLKDLWFAYDLDRTTQSHNHMGPEDEYLVSNTGTRYEAAPHDVKKSRIKGWMPDAPYVYDDMSDETLAGLIGRKRNADGTAFLEDHDVKHAAKFHKNAGPAVYAKMRELWDEPGGVHSIPAGKPPIGSFGFKWFPREEVMKAASAPGTVIDAPAWFRNPNLTSQDLEVLAPKLFANRRGDSYTVSEAAEELLSHPAMNSHVLERLWKGQHGTPWAPKLLSSPLATHQMREDAVEMAKFQSPAGLQVPLRLMSAVTDSPHHTREQALKVYDWAVQNGAFGNNSGFGMLLARAKLPAETMLKLYDRYDELWSKEEAGNAALGLRPGTRAIGTPDEHAERVAIGAVLTAFAQSNPQADVVAQLAASKPGRVDPKALVNRMGNNGQFLEPETQAALINEATRLDAQEPGFSHGGSFLEKLAGSKKLTPESIGYLANHSDDMVRDVLFRNKSVAPEQLREAFPKSIQFPERPNIHFDTNTTVGGIAESIAQAYWRRKQFEDAKAQKHFVKPLPQNLAKSSAEDLWRAQARSWLADQSTDGFYAIVHKDVADGAIRDMAIEPQFTDEVLDGEAVFASPATPANLDRLQTEAGPDDVVLYFETEVEPQQHTDGRSYWTGRVPCETVHIADVGQEPLAKMHTPLTFPKLGVGDDRRETKLVSTPGQRKTFFRAAAVQSLRENYTGQTAKDIQRDPSLGAKLIGIDAASMSKLKSQGVTHEGIAGVGHPGAGIKRDDRAGIPGAGTGQSAISAAFTMSATPRRAFSAPNQRQMGDPRYLPQVVHHEDLHRIFARVQHKHGEQERMMLARNLVHALPQDLQSAVMKHLFYAQPKYQTDANPEEEAITELGSYLNQPQLRDDFSRKQQHSPEQQKAFHDKMKRAYRLLLAVAPTADEGWLHHEKPWMKRGVAMRKFTEPQGYAALSAAEAHDIFKGSNKLSKSMPDLLNANAFAFKFETDPKLYDAVVERHQELELRKAGEPGYLDDNRPLWWHGTPSGDLRGGATGLHVGSRKAAEEALHARIGIPAEGTWDGTREYGKTLLAGQKSLRARGIYPTGYNSSAPEEDHYPTGAASFSDGTPVLPTHKPSVFPLRITGRMSNTWRTPHQDFAANGRMASLLRRGSAKSGYYYRNEGEDSGSISATLPGASHVTLGGWDIQKSEEHMDIALPHEKVLGPGEESAAKAFLGHRKDHETALAAARFLVGRKEPVDEDMFRVAMSVFDGDHERAALIAVGLTDSEANLRALRAALKLGEFSPDHVHELTKNEPGTPHIESVNPGAPDAAETADEVRRGATAGLVQPLVLGGKHSKGSMAVRDPKTGDVWLLKPGSGKQSPAAGARDDASSQSAREAAFWHCADRVGLGNYYPKADLLEVNGGQVAAMKLLGTQWKSLDERNRQVDGYAREVLQTYLDRGDVHRLAALDWILGNPDSHGQNVMVHAEAVALIDHGSAFAGPNFAPGKDSKSFTPYYLRVFAPGGYSKKRPEDRVRGLPRLNPAGDIAFKKWVQGIDPSLLAETMGSHGIGKVAQEAVLARLSDLQHHGGSSLSEHLNGLWAGL